MRIKIHTSTNVNFLWNSKNPEKDTIDSITDECQKYFESLKKSSNEIPKASKQSCKSLSVKQEVTAYLADGESKYLIPKNIPIQDLIKQDEIIFLSIKSKPGFGTTRTRKRNLRRKNVVFNKRKEATSVVNNSGKITKSTPKKANKQKDFADALTADTSNKVIEEDIPSVEASSQVDVSDVDMSDADSEKTKNMPITPITSNEPETLIPPAWTKTIKYKKLLIGGIECSIPGISNSSLVLPEFPYTRKKYKPEERPEFKVPLAISPKLKESAKVLTDFRDLARGDVIMITYLSLSLESSRPEPKVNTHFALVHEVHVSGGATKNGIKKQQLYLKIQLSKKNIPSVIKESTLFDLDAQTDRYYDYGIRTFKEEINILNATKSDDENDETLQCASTPSIYNIKVLMKGHVVYPSTWFITKYEKDE